MSTSTSRERSPIWPSPAYHLQTPEEHLAEPYPDRVPRSDYRQPSACPWCQRVHPGGPRWGVAPLCCGGRSRCMGAAELRARGLQWAARGYPGAARGYARAVRALEGETIHWNN